MLRTTLITGIFCLAAAAGQASPITIYFSGERASNQGNVVGLVGVPGFDLYGQFSFDSGASATSTLFTPNIDTGTYGVVSLELDFGLGSYSAAPGVSMTVRDGKAGIHNDGFSISDPNGGLLGTGAVKSIQMFVDGSTQSIWPDIGFPSVASLNALAATATQGVSILFEDPANTTPGLEDAVTYRNLTFSATSLAPPAAVPLPAAGWMLMAGVAGLLGLRRRRRAA